MRFILIIMLTIPLSTIAEEGWFKNRKVTEDNIWQEHDSAFIAQLFLSDDPETIYNHQNKGPANKVQFVDLTQVKAGKRYEAIIVFSGCDSDKNDQCVITGDWVVKIKNGDLLGEMNDSPIYIGPGPRDEQQLMISTNGLGFAADSEVRGYLIKATVRDKNGNKSVTLQRSIDVE